MNLISHGEANGRIILVAEKMGYKVNPLAKEQAIMLTQGDTIEPFYMGMIDSESAALHNAILQDGRINEGNKISQELRN